MGIEARSVPVCSFMTFQQKCPVNNSLPPPLAPPQRKRTRTLNIHTILSITTSPSSASNITIRARRENSEVIRDLGSESFLWLQVRPLGVSKPCRYEAAAKYLIFRLVLQSPPLSKQSSLYTAATFAKLLQFTLRKFVTSYIV
jgi:hypothetical protein